MIQGKLLLRFMKSGLCGIALRVGDFAQGEKRASRE
jgi:hypothetical protein